MVDNVELLGAFEEEVLGGYDEDNLLSVSNRRNSYGCFPKRLLLAKIDVSHATICLA